MSSNPKFLLVGAWQWPWYEQACATALRAIGCEVEPFGWFSDFRRWVNPNPEPVYQSFSARLQYRLLIGPTVSKMNRRLVETAQTTQPDVVWLYNATHVYPRTTRQLRRMLPNATLVQYANDNPFAHCGRFDTFRYIKQSVPEFDLHLAYRHANLREYEAAGAKAARLLRSYYIADEDFRLEPAPNDTRFRCDVLFAGHFENDGRAAALEALMEAGLRVNVFGGGWGAVLDKLAPASPLRNLFPVRPVVGDEYRKAISGAKVALCFLSKLNHDTYTRRNFQIPAMRTFMLSEYTDDLASLYKPGVEAEYYHSQQELIEKAKYYVADDDAREAIARRGHERLLRDGHDVTSRMRQLIKHIQELRA